MKLNTLISIGLVPLTSKNTEGQFNREFIPGRRTTHVTAYENTEPRGEGGEAAEHDTMDERAGNISELTLVCIDLAARLEDVVDVGERRAIVSEHIRNYDGAKIPMVDFEAGEWMLFGGYFGWDELGLKMLRCDFF